MQRVRLTKNSRHGKANEIVVMDNNEAFGLIDSGQAELTKDMTSDDYQTSGVKNGKPSHLRPHKSK